MSSDHPQSAENEFWELRASRLDFSAQQWEAYYPALAKWLVHSNHEIRDCTIERLCTAVFWAEHSAVRPAERSEQAQLARLAWMLKLVASAQLVHADTLTQFLKHLRFSGRSQPYTTALLDWLDKLAAQLPAGVDAGLVQGIRLLHEPPDGEWSVRAAKWLSLLDDPSDPVRSCAAYRLGGDYDEDNCNPTDDEVIAIVSAKEIERPGLAGPLWSERHMGDWPAYINLWMLDLLERRKGSAPANALFNDINFYLHELCSNSPDQVLRMMRGNFMELALMTATEHDAPIPGMQPVLQALADCADKRVAGGARAHLARVYKVPSVLPPPHPPPQPSP